MQHAHRGGRPGIWYCGAGCVVTVTDYLRARAHSSAAYMDQSRIVLCSHIYLG